MLAVTFDPDRYHPDRSTAPRTPEPVVPPHDPPITAPGPWQAPHPTTAPGVAGSQGMDRWRPAGPDLAEEVGRLADAIAGWRTTKIGEMSVSEPINPPQYRFKPKPCPKCQSEDARVIFHAKARFEYNLSCGTNDVAQRASEHLHVHCQVCHFDWTEGLQKRRKT